VKGIVRGIDTGKKWGKTLMSGKKPEHRGYGVWGEKGKVQLSASVKCRACNVIGSGREAENVKVKRVYE